MRGQLRREKIPSLYLQGIQVPVETSGSSQSSMLQLGLLGGGLKLFIEATFLEIDSKHKHFMMN